MEVMVAMVILTIGLMSDRTADGECLQEHRALPIHLVAATLASEKLEDLNSYSPSDYRGKLAGGSLTANHRPRESNLEHLHRIRQLLRHRDLE